MSNEPPRRAFRLSRGARDVRREVDDEITFHFERRVADLVAGGMSPDDALTEARRSFGDVEGFRRELTRIDTRQASRRRRGDWLADLAQDARFALRGMRRAPGFTIVALLTLALGIGATAATFSIVNGVLLRPLPYKEPDRLVRLWERTSTGERVAIAGPNLEDWRTAARTLAPVAGYGGGDAIVLGADEAMRAQVIWVTPGFFSVFGVAPARGRLPSPDEHTEGGARVIVVSHDFWTRHLASDPDVASRVLTIGDRKYTVVGVMPPGFAYPADAEIWLPTAVAPGESRTAHNWQAVARLAPGATVAQAASDLSVIAGRVRAQMGSEVDAIGATVVSLQEALVGRSRTTLLLLLGAVLCVLLVACVNLASGALARGEARRQEMAMRLALGAARGRLARQLLTESVLLSIVGGALGLGLGAVMLRQVLALAPRSIPRLDDVTLDWRAVLVTLLAAGLTGVVIGSFPAWQAARTSLQRGLSTGGRGGVRGSGGRGRRVLIGAESALVVILLTGAGLLVRSFRHLLAQETGFRPGNVLTADLALPPTRYPDSTRALLGWSRVLEEVRGIPGVDAAGVIGFMPFGVWHPNGSLVVDGESERRVASYNGADEGYFTAFGVPLRRGRLFTAEDRAGSPHVAVVNETLARTYWPNGDALGKRLRFLGMDLHNEVWLTVVGIVGDVRQTSLSSEIDPEIYVNLRQRPERLGNGASLIIHTTRDVAALTRTVRDRLRALDPDIPARFATMDEIVDRSTADRRFTMLVMTGFSAFALFLAAVGLYGVLSYAVVQRHREIGVRMALGAARGRVVRMVLGDGMRAVIPGVVAGIIGALALSRLIQSLLFGVAPNDPVTLGTVVALLSLVAVLASLVPAVRATRVDPLVAIRAE